MATAKVLSAFTLPDGSREVTAVLVADNNVTILHTLTISVPADALIADVRADLKARFIAWYKASRATRTVLNVGATTLATDAELTA